ncbi:MAG: lipoprotein [Candidatus Omnitrophica bacterium]|nr:lipoprotein [Candidatus Omnitrophota bacterium]
MSKKMIVLLGLIFILSGCSIYHVNSEETTTNYHPPKTSSTEIAYLETVTEVHEVVGVVTVNTERRQTLDEVMEKMKREAAILGGDAITDIQTDVSGTWKRIVPRGFKNAGVRATFTAKVISFNK